MMNTPTPIPAMVYQPGAGTLNPQMLGDQSQFMTTNIVMEIDISERDIVSETIIVLLRGMLGNGVHITLAHSATDDDIKTYVFTTNMIVPTFGVMHIMTLMVLLSWICDIRQITHNNVDYITITDEDKDFKDIVVSFSPRYSVCLTPPCMDRLIINTAIGTDIAVDDLVDEYDEDHSIESNGSHTSVYDINDNIKLIWDVINYMRSHPKFVNYINLNVEGSIIPIM